MAARTWHCAHLPSCDIAVAQAVPVAPGTHGKSAVHVRACVKGRVGYPVVIKVPDGGGGRRMRVVSAEEGVEQAFKRCTAESTSGQLFAERALSGLGWMHIEVQIVGDAAGDVARLCELQDSVQRRFQKRSGSRRASGWRPLPSCTIPRNLVKSLLAVSTKMVRALRHQGAGAFEHFVNSHTGGWVFLEINARVAVEHTVTEELTHLDLVRIQLLLSSATLAPLNLTPASISPPQGCAMHLRLTVDDLRFSAGAIPAQLHRVARGTRGVHVNIWLCGVPS